MAPRVPSSSSNVEACCKSPMCGILRAAAVRRSTSDKSSTVDAKTIRTNPSARRLTTNRMCTRERKAIMGVEFTTAKWLAQTARLPPPVYEKRGLSRLFRKQCSRLRQCLFLMNYFVTRRPIGTAHIERIENQVTTFGAVKLGRVLKSGVVNDGRLSALHDLHEQLPLKSALAGA